ncbi:hypothetical protein D0866_14540 [Hortaea werneckii]|nr:hypothetical protein D0866_14540 [Hortaea werneckii]
MHRVSLVPTLNHHRHGTFASLLPPLPLLTGLCRLEQVEGAVCHMSETLQELKPKFAAIVPASSESTAFSTWNGKTDHSSASSQTEKCAGQSPELQPAVIAQGHSLGQNLSVPHRVFLWPFIYRFLSESSLPLASDLAQIKEDGTKWFIRRELAKHPCSLPSRDRSLFKVPTMHFSPALTAEQTNAYIQAYFGTFNVLLPILDYDVFVHTIMARLSREGYAEDDLDAVLALLVLALGKLASDGVFGEPVSVHNGVASGFRGGSLDNPPGLYLFNQARQRLGFVDSICTLGKVQIYILQAIYYEANGHHLEFWKSTTAASATIQVLLKLQQFQWETRIGDMISRAYWACLLQEDLYHLDLDLPRTEIHQFEDEVPMPTFDSRPTVSTGQYGWETEQFHFQYHFLAMSALRRLIVRIHTTIHDASTVRAETTDGYGGAPVSLIHEMGRQLDSWRSLLPELLQWRDDDAFKFPIFRPSTSEAHVQSFSHNEAAGLVGDRHNSDMLTAHLRTRFYYARYVLYRPFVFKALHYPELMSAVDVEYCALAINSMCLWPSLMAPPKLKKRLVPHLYTWTQNHLGMLLIFQAIRRRDSLARICDEKIGLQRVQETTELMMDWMRDAKQVDGTAEWGWKVMELVLGKIDG